MPHDPTPATDRLRDLHRRGPRSRTNPPDPGHHAILPTRISAFTAHQPHASSQVSAICSPKTCSSDPSQGYLRRADITYVDQLAGRDPVEIYETICERDAQRYDPCHASWTRSCPL